MGWINEVMMVVTLAIASIGIGMLLEVNYGYGSKIIIAQSIAESINENTRREDSLPSKHIEYYGKVPMVENNLTIQIIGKDIKIKDVYFTQMAYTGSMIPVIHGGNRVLKQPYSLRGIKQNGTCSGLSEGMIIEFKDVVSNSKNSIVHRIIDNSIGDGQLRTKGDANHASEFIPCEAINSIIVGVLYT